MSSPSPIPSWPGQRGDLWPASAWVSCSGRSSSSSATLRTPSTSSGASGKTAPFPGRSRTTCRSCSGSRTPGGVRVRNGLPRLAGENADTELEVLGALQPLILLPRNTHPTASCGAFHVPVHVPSRTEGPLAVGFCGDPRRTVYRSPVGVHHVQWELPNSTHLRQLRRLPSCWLAADSWLIVLAGPKIPRPHQKRFSDSVRCGAGKSVFRRTLALWVTNRVSRYFAEPGAPLTAAGLNNLTGIRTSS